MLLFKGSDGKLKFMSPAQIIETAVEKLEAHARRKMRVKFNASVASELQRLHPGLSRETSNSTASLAGWHGRKR